jgi:hypothetical protein
VPAVDTNGNKQCRVVALGIALLVIRYGLVRKVVGLRVSILWVGDGRHAAQFLRVRLAVQSKSIEG